MRKRIIGTSLGACLLTVAIPTLAAELAVVQSNAPAYEPGNLLQTESTITLAAGEFIVVAAEDGRISRLEGPRSEPAANALASGSQPVADSDVLGALVRLFGGREPELGGLAGVRGGEDEQTSVDTRPEAWLIHAQRSGDQCFVGDAPVELWRELSGTPTSSEVTDITGGVTAQVEWDSEAQRTAWPSNPAPLDGRVYLLRGDDQVRSIAITLRALPPEIDDHEHAAVAWLAAEGCARQARLLLAQILAREAPE